MNEFDELKSLIICLTNSEKKDLLNKVFYKGDSVLKGKTLSLFESISNNHHISELESFKSISSGSTKASFRKLISRMIEKILDSILSDENIKNNSIYDKRALEIFKLEKQLLIAEILRYRGLFSLADKKIDKVISQCKIYEHYDILLFAMDKFKRWNLDKLSKNQLLNYEAEYRKYYKCKLAVKQALDIFTNVLKIGVDWDNKKEEKYLNISIIKLNRILKATESKYVKYYLYYLLIQKYNILRKYKVSLKYADELLEFIIFNLNIYSKVRHGNALLNKGVILRNIFMFDAALQNLAEAKKYFLDLPQNNIIIYEQFIITYIYSGNIVKAKYYLNLALNDLSFKENKSNLIFDYYFLVVNFIDSSYKENQRLLALISRNYSKFELKFQFRILEILNYIELKRFDESDNCIESLRKFVDRYGESLINLKKVKIVVRILIYLIKNGYNFNSVYSLNQKLFNSLLNYSNELNFKEYEMIPFHEWFDAKVKNVPYNHVEAMKRLKKLNTSKA